MSDPPPTFLTIPLEIRLQIYAEVFSPWFGHKPPPTKSEYKPPLSKYPLAITSVCQQVRQESFPLIIVNPRHLQLDRCPSLCKLMSSKYLGIMSAVRIHIDQPTLLEIQKDVLLPLKDIATTVPYSGEWWLATYQSRMSWLPRTRTSLLRRSLSSMRTREIPSSLIISTWETLRKIQHIKSLELSFGKAKTHTENEQRLLLEMISFTCPHIESLTVPTYTGASSRLLLTSRTNFHNLHHVDWYRRKIDLTSPNPAYIDPRLLEFYQNRRSWEAVMGGGSTGLCVVTIVPLDHYMEAFRRPVSPDPRKMMDFDSH